MSTLKTSDNATLPEPVGSPGRKLQRRQAKGSKMVATARSRGARQAKERMMPKKLKQQSRAEELEKKFYEATPVEKEALGRYLARKEGRPSAPRVSIRQEGETDVIALTQGDPLVSSAVVMDALGICEAEFANWYLSQIINVAKPGARADEKTTNAMIAGIAAMRPRDEAEAMLIAQMIATHELAMTFARRLKHVENIPQQDSAANALTKLTRTYAAQMAGLKHYRTGGEQRVIVQRVDVREGGQAVVGIVNSGNGKGGDGPERNRGKSHAKQIADARDAALLCDVETEREAVPSAGGAGTPDLPDARRD
jgi:hypothetical protein